MPRQRQGRAQLGSPKRAPARHVRPAVRVRAIHRAERTKSFTRLILHPHNVNSFTVQPSCRCNDPRRPSRFERDKRGVAAASSPSSSCVCVHVGIMISRLLAKSLSKRRDTRAAGLKISAAAAPRTQGPGVSVSVEHLGLTIQVELIIPALPGQTCGGFPDCDGDINYTSRRCPI